jgi:hypothetical protein
MNAAVKSQGKMSPVGAKRQLQWAQPIVPSQKQNVSPEGAKEQPLRK